MTREDRLAALEKARAVRAAKQKAQLAAGEAEKDSDSYVLALEDCLRAFLDATAVKYAAGGGAMRDRCVVCEDHVIPGRPNTCPCQEARRLLAEHGSATA